MQKAKRHPNRKISMLTTFVKVLEVGVRIFCFTNVNKAKSGKPNDTQLARYQCWSPLSISWKLVFDFCASRMLAEQNTENQTTPKSQDISAEMGSWHLEVNRFFFYAGTAKCRKPNDTQIARYQCWLPLWKCWKLVFEFSVSRMLTKQKAESQTIPNLQDINADPLCQ